MPQLATFRKPSRKKSRVGILGAGSWGTAIAYHLGKKGVDVRVWDHLAQRAALIQKERINGTYLPGVLLPENIEFTNSLEGFGALDLHILAIPTQFVRSFFMEFGKELTQDKPLISLSKGIENRTLLRISEIAAEFFPQKPYLVLTGPTHAEEVARNVPSAIVAASIDKALIQHTIDLFMSDTFRIYPSLDVTGAEIGGAMKNIIAIATGISDGLKLGDNTRAAIMTRGLEEIRRIGVALGAKTETFMGLSGIGDLIVTCSSEHSRNRRVGKQLGEGKSIKSILEGMQMVAEGVRTTESAFMLCKSLKLEAPITSTVYEILYKNLSTRKAIGKLMTRKVRPEQWN